MIIIVDFGSQTTHLIGRRLIELGAAVQIAAPVKALTVVLQNRTRGIILSGGPSSVYDAGAPTIDRAIFQLKIPVLGICYGLQLMSQLLGGVVRRGAKKEFGPAVLQTVIKSDLLSGTKTKPFPTTFTVWMSHGDVVVKLPAGFCAVAETKTTLCAAVENAGQKIYGLQFHPEVIHTQFGQDILANFLRLCGLTPKARSIDKDFVDDLIADIADSIGSESAVCALSGGIDSSVAAILTYRAIGHRLKALYVDSGLMRQGETAQLRQIFQRHYQMKIKVIPAQKIFLKSLAGVVNPEKKRQIIGRTFIKVLEREAAKISSRFLVQGTIYPDVIESAGTAHSSKIKTHHNVAGLPKKMKLILTEPLRHLYKDQVRAIGRILRLPDAVVYRQPFPGPGLAIRIVGGVTRKKLALVRVADEITQEELRRAKLKQKLWQAFAVLPGVKTTGVSGDGRAYGETVALRAVAASDAMSARWSPLPHRLLDVIATRIVNEVSGVNRVVYDITNKPPGTIEWE